LPSGDVDALIDVADFEHLILENDLLPSQEQSVKTQLVSACAPGGGQHAT
jgi:hypothetical protein